MANPSRSLYRLGFLLPEWLLHRVTICGALQLPVSDWHEYLGGGRVADAILDRLVHNAHRIELRSQESMRKEYSAVNHGGQSVE